jgi:hypothetical protein
LNKKFLPIVNSPVTISSHTPFSKGSKKINIEYLQTNSITQLGKPHGIKNGLGWELEAWLKQD